MTTQDPTPNADAADAKPTQAALARIEPAKQLRIPRISPVASMELERIRTLQIGAAVLIGILGMLAWPFGQRLVRFVFVAGIVFLIVGLLSSRTNVLIRNYLARRRAEKLGEISFTNGVLVVPSDHGPQQFDLQSPHTLLRAWERREGDGVPRVITSLFLAQDGEHTTLFSDEASSSEEARDYGFRAEDAIAVKFDEHGNHIQVPLVGLHELSRRMDSFLEQRNA